METEKNIAALVLALWMGWAFGLFKIAARFRFQQGDTIGTRLLVIAHGVLYVLVIPLAFLGVLSTMAAGLKSPWFVGGIASFIAGMVLSVASWMTRETDPKEKDSCEPGAPGYRR